MTKLRWVGRIFGYGIPIAFMLIFGIANQIHWPQSLLASNNLAFGCTIMFLSIPLVITGVFDVVIPSKSDPSFLESPSNNGQGQRS
jgi:hypothetical protein